jgi:hypothetical protein
MYWLSGPLLPCEGAPFRCKVGPCFTWPVPGLPCRSQRPRRLHGRSRVRQAVRRPARPVRSLQHTALFRETPRLPCRDAARRRRARLGPGHPAFLTRGIRPTAPKTRQFPGCSSAPGTTRSCSPTDLRPSRGNSAPGPGTPPETGTRPCMKNTPAAPLRASTAAGYRLGASSTPAPMVTFP